MNNLGKTIQIFLPDGNPRGVKIAEVTNRTVQAILIPRNLLNDSNFRIEMNNVSLYFLFGNSEDNAKPEVYIGEAEDGFERLKQHNKDKGKDFWDVAVLIITNNIQNQFTKSDVKFLENFSYNKAKETDRYYLVNQKIPTKSFVPEWRISDLNDIFETLKLLLSALGYTLFDELIKNKGTISEDDDVFFCSGKGINAKGILVDDGFVVLKGSQMALNFSESFVKKIPSHIHRVENLLKAGIILKEESYYIFLKDHLFNSPSMASSTVLRNSSNGWIDWKDKKGKTLDEIKRQNNK